MTACLEMPVACETARARRASARDVDARRSVYLHPGQMFVSATPAEVTTILGSCVAVCVWDRLLRVGGANHYLLPHGVGSGPSSSRFGNVALRRLIDEVLALGCRRSDLEAKVFGGACVLEALRGKGRHLGRKNVEAAFAVLRQEGIPVVAEDTGGGRGRRVVFHTDDGAAWVKRL
jgi:chemotaxis protein CheD